MLKNIIPLAIIIGVAYWYWSGPYQEKNNPSYAQKLEVNNDAMSKCLFGKSYASGAGRGSAGDPGQQCAKKLNLYEEGGQWHSYDDIRPDNY